MKLELFQIVPDIISHASRKSTHYQHLDSRSQNSRYIFVVLLRIVAAGNPAFDRTHREQGERREHHREGERVVEDGGEEDRQEVGGERSQSHDEEGDESNRCCGNWVGRMFVVGENAFIFCKESIYPDLLLYRRNSEERGRKRSTY